jgi:hypothetical protein
VYNKVDLADRCAPDDFFVMREEIMSKEFDSWLASYLGEKKSEVSLLIRDRTALDFLISWSIFESDCFSGFCKLDEIKSYSVKLVESAKYRTGSISRYVEHFHERYQQNKLYKNLMHKQKCKNAEIILSKKINDLEENEKVFLLVLVVYRYRNNIFHGNKGVSSWLAYKEQIKMCCEVMHHFIGMSEVAHNKSKHTDAA